MAVSLSVVGSFAGVKTIPAAEEMSTTDISLYQEENQTQEKIEVQTETSPQLETSAAITESPHSESIQPESTQPESTSLETESTIETASEHEETTVGEDVSETITETAIETTVEESPEESSGENIFAEESSEEVSSEEMTEEESTEEIEEETTEFEYGIDFLDLGDVTQIIQILSCRIEGSQVIVKGKLNHKFKTADEKLYLFEEPMYQKDITGSPIADVKKEDTFEFSVPLNNNTAQSKLYSKFFVGMKFRDGTYQALSDGCFITNPEALAENQSSYPQARSKKGLLTDTVFGTDIEELGLSYTNVNIIMNELINGSGYSYTYNGKTYHFNGLYGYVYLVQQCNAKGIQVTAQISIDRNASTQRFITGNSPYAETAYYGWNTDNSTTRQTMEAMFAYLGEKFGKNNCYISNWILGNEVNSASGYYYVGNVSFSKFISMYSEAFRCLYNAVKSSRGSSKVFICLDNCWNQKNAFTICYSARSTLESFAAKISDMQKDVNWNLAYHAYNQPLSDSQFWSGANASMFTSDANTTTFITMRNIQTLTDYVKNRFGSNTRIILSEQGFSSTYGGQANQAAAIALAYYKAACNPMIDAFIIRSYKDEAHEVAQGLAMGLKDANGKKKTAYNVFKNMDSSNSLKYTEKVLKSQVGNWKSLVPGYSTGKISSMYRK